MFTLGDVLRHKAERSGKGKRKPKIYLRDMRRWDSEKHDTTVRELEMTVDHELRETAYAMQFWRDVALYGICEAILYVSNDSRLLRNTDSLRKIQTKADEIFERMLGKQ